MNSIQDDFRLNMKYYREKKGLSQIQLAIGCNCGTGTIGGIESGKAKPSFDMIIKIAQALDVSPADLFIREVSKTKKEIKKELTEKLDNFIASI